jgi:hypothetical protein
MTRRLTAVLVPLALVALLAGCGGGSAPSTLPTIGAAHRYTLANLRPTVPFVPGKPTRVSFVIRQPDGQPLTQFKRGPGPHTGVHLILVRRDLGVIVHHHPPISPDGTIHDTVSLPSAGPYRVVVDVYPKSTAAGSNFQLFGSVTARGTYEPEPIGAFKRSEVVDGYRFTLHGNPNLHAIQAAFLKMTVTNPQGRPATFSPWYGALAHAIFFRKGSLDYFHTHVCAPQAAGCTSVLGAAKVTGSSSTPGKLTIGVLVPIPGTWRLFLQCQVDGRILTAPFTLTVKA